MKIQCNGCEAAEANVLCCADKAALCWNCDQKVHAANKLASMHERVPLSSSISQVPNCDICQESVGYFFCLEDRALLCRKCDVAIHTVNALVSAHQRFLLTGVKVGLEATEPGPSPCTGKTQFTDKISETEPRSIPKRTPLVPTNGSHNKSLSIESGLPNICFAGDAAAGSVSQWPLEELLGLDGFNRNYGFVNNDSSKADSGKLGDSNSSQVVRAPDRMLDGDEYMGHVPDAFWAVPQVASPPTASTLFWPKNYQNPLDCAVSVPEICTSQLQNFYPHEHQTDITSSKRKRQF